MLESLEPFNCVQTIVIFVCKQISSDSFKDKITRKPLSYKSYIYPFNYVQTNEFWFVKNVISKLCIYKS